MIQGNATRLIVTIDTEEEGLWGGVYRRTGNSVENVRGVVRFQSLCDEFGIRPTYLVDAPVVEDDEAADLLRGMQVDGRAEIGAHLHPWCNPPLETEKETEKGSGTFCRNGPAGASHKRSLTPFRLDERNSYLCNLPESLQRDKIAWLTDQIAKRCGRRPTSFRAGRYGLDIVGARVLTELGYTVDSSVIPFTDYSSESGPSFRHAPYDPYFVGDRDLSSADVAGRLLEVPVTVGYNRVNFRRADAIRGLAASTPWRQLKCVGILDRLGLVQRIKFSPEQADTRHMRRVVDVRLRQGAPCLVMMFHSSSLAAGHSPYVPDSKALEQFYQRLSDVFEYCVCQRQLPAATLTEFAEAFRGDTGQDSQVPQARKLVSSK